MHQPNISIRILIFFYIEIKNNFFKKLQLQISSPGYPLGYPQNADCVYYVSGNPGKKLVIDFSELSSINYLITPRSFSLSLNRGGGTENE